ncbi:hypothetical protein WJ968_32940 [Achromobacter xylosoxidans]|uniref:hypothetical protein n=1 Tax=Alcaligenes xylosoxydans xylosoxydans TaxID=85698 RepID=UPI0006C16558|nr:hypothetical protein [Achromobacter xylosoxidans]CUJ71706.1 Uncharacterised protein [Achromobacter xylosoxidans]
MSKYMWVWKDDDGIYQNKAESLAEIIEEVIEYYDEEVEDLTVKVKGQSLVVNFLSYLDNDWDEFDSKVTVEQEGDLNRVQYVIRNEPWDAAYFLECMARLSEVCSREDKFLIACL